MLIFGWGVKPVYHPPIEMVDMTDIIEIPEAPLTTSTLNERKITVLTATQERIDKMVDLIEKKLGKLEGFNKWVDEAGTGHFIYKLACILAKTPFRIARNIVRLIYQAIKCIVYGMTHPVKALAELKTIAGKLAIALTKAETWLKMGWGLMGAGIGNCAVTLNPFALFISVGGFLCLFAGFLLTEEAIKLEDIQKWLDAFMTGFISGATFGAIYEPPAYSLEDYVKDYTGDDGVTDVHNRYRTDTIWYRDSDGWTRYITLEDSTFEYYNNVHDMVQPESLSVQPSLASLGVKQ